MWRVYFIWTWENHFFLILPPSAGETFCANDHVVFVCSGQQRKDLKVHSVGSCACREPDGVVVICNGVPLLSDLGSLARASCLLFRATRWERMPVILPKVVAESLSLWTLQNFVVVRRLSRNASGFNILSFWLWQMNFSFNAMMTDMLILIKNVRHFILGFCLLLFFLSYDVCNGSGNKAKLKGKQHL